MSLEKQARTWAAAVAAAAFLLLSPEALAQGCAMCRTAVEGQDDPLTRGLSHSVLFMISMPFAVFFSAAGWLFFSHRKAKAAGRIEEPPPAAGSGNPAGDTTVTGGT